MTAIAAADEAAAVEAKAAADRAGGKAGSA